MILYLANNENWGKGFAKGIRRARLFDLNT
jgi:hypothetical protein